MIKPWKYLLSNPKYSLYSDKFKNWKREYPIYKLDHNNLQYIKVNKKIYYVLWYDMWLFIFEWEDFTLEKWLHAIYRWIDVYLMYKLFCNQFAVLLDDNIIFSNPFSYNIILRTYWFSYTIHEYDFTEVLSLSIRVPNIHIKKRNIAPKDFLKYLRKFIISKSFCEKLKFKNMSFFSGDYIEHMDTYSILFSFN
jgi:hypothetical protein